MVDLAKSEKELFREHIQILLGKVEKILEVQQKEALLIYSGFEHSLFLDDQHYPFKINPSFNYFVPLNNLKKSFLFIRPGQKPVLHYFAPADFWYPVPKKPEGFWVDEFEIILETNFDKINPFHGINAKNISYIGEELAWPKEHGISHENVNHEKMLNEVHFMRISKTPYEVFCLKKANELAAPGHIAARDAFFSGKCEFEINHEYLKACDITENEAPYHTIIGINENASILHYDMKVKKKNAPNKNLSLLIDAGVSYNGYGSDITRTYTTSQNGLFFDLLEQVKIFQDELTKIPAIDIPYSQNHLKAHDFVAKTLLDLQILKGIELEEAVSEKISKFFFPHGLGHLLGLQVHDVSGYHHGEKGPDTRPPKDHPYLRFFSNIRDGHVFTVEPGIYFGDVLMKDLKNSKFRKYVDWGKIDELMPYGGIRLEDNIYMDEKKGPINLTRPFLDL